MKDTYIALTIINNIMQELDDKCFHNELLRELKEIYFRSIKFNIYYIVSTLDGEISNRLEYTQVINQ